LWRFRLRRACPGRSIAHLRFPLDHHKVIRTTNSLERLFGEERWRTKMIANFFGERPVLKLMYAALIHASEQWHRITISQFERTQLQNIRQELDDAHRRRHGPATKDTASTSLSGFSSGLDRGYPDLSFSSA
jgi:hypothetical protein